jgi:hypothetical protein
VRVLARRPADDDGELHGLYEPDDPPKPAHITVWMRTAARKDVVAFKTFLRTLIHELCHHLDYELYELAETFHTEASTSANRRWSTRCSRRRTQGPPPSRLGRERQPGELNAGSQSIKGHPTHPQAPKLQEFGSSLLLLAARMSE